VRRRDVEKRQASRLTCWTSLKFAPNAPFDNAIEPQRGKSDPQGVRLWHWSFRFGETLGVNIYVGVATLRSAVQEAPRLPPKMAPALPALADPGPTLGCPTLLYASGQTPGSIGPIPWQQAYEQRSTRETDREKI